MSPVPPYNPGGGGGGPVGDADTLQGQNGAYYRNRANHTGTQTAATISDFNAAADARAAIAAAAIVDSAPGTLDTLNELAAALGDDPNFAATTAASIGNAQTAADAAQADIDAHEADATNAHAASAIGSAPTGDVAATDVQGAIAELASEKATTAALTAHTGAVAGAHAATAVSNTPAGTIAATTVQDALNELDSEKAAAGSVTTVQGNLDAHTGDATDAHAGTAITNTPAGNIAATTVQAAINELDSEKAAVANAVMDGDSAGGDLTGTYPSPTVAALAITDAKVAAANKDGAAGTASMRTLGTGALQATAGNDSRLSDARTPTGSAGGVLSGTYPNPGFAADMATQAELDAHINNTTGAHAGTAISNTPAGTISSTTVQAAINELDGDVQAISAASQQVIKIVRAASTANVNVASAPSSIDGVTLAASDRILLKNQSTASQNGIYVFSAAAAALTRSTDWDATADVPFQAFFVAVQQGTNNQGTVWENRDNAAITVGSSSVTMTRSALGSHAGGAGTAPSFAYKTDAFTINSGAGNLQLAVQPGQIDLGNATDGHVVNLFGALVSAPSLITGNTTLSSNSKQFQEVNTTAGVVTVTLPASPSDGQRFTIIDAGSAGAGNALVNNITIGRNGKNINGSAADLTVAVNRTKVELIYLDATRQWVTLYNGI